MPTKVSDNFVCRECRHRRSKVTESSPNGDKRLCVHCFKRMHPGEALTTGDALQMILKLASESSTQTASTTVHQALVKAPLKSPPPLPFEDADILAACESPEFQLELSLKNRITLKHEAEITKTRIDALNESLLAFYKRNGIHGVLYDGYPVTIMHGSRPTIKAELLLAAGVAADVIERCTDKTEFETIMVREPKREKGEFTS